MSESRDERPKALPPGPFKAADATASGITSWELRQLIRSGEVRRVFREVYAPAAMPDSIHLRAASLAVIAPPHAVICDRTAAWLWDVDVFRHQELATIPRLETVVLPGRTRLRRPEARGGERDLRPEDIVRVGAVNVTTPLRTAMDLACGLTRYEALAALDAFDRTHGVGRVGLAELLPRYRGRRGVVQARELVPLVDGSAESGGESFTRLAVSDAGLPAPETQYWVRVGGVATYRLDLAYPRLKVCVEYDGEEFHSSKEDQDRDRRRRAWLRDHGWVVIVVTKDDMRGAARERWLQELRTALADRSK